MICKKQGSLPFTAWDHLLFHFCTGVFLQVFCSILWSIQQVQCRRHVCERFFLATSVFLLFLARVSCQFIGYKTCAMVWWAQFASRATGWIQLWLNAHKGIQSPSAQHPRNSCNSHFTHLINPFGLHSFDDLVRFGQEIFPYLQHLLGMILTSSLLFRKKVTSDMNLLTALRYMHPWLQLYCQNYTAERGLVDAWRLAFNSFWNACQRYCPVHVRAGRSSEWKIVTEKNRSEDWLGCTSSAVPVLLDKVSGSLAMRSTGKPFKTNNVHSAYWKSPSLSCLMWSCHCLGCLPSSPWAERCHSQEACWRK